VSNKRIKDSREDGGEKDTKKSFYPLTLTLSHKGRGKRYLILPEINKERKR